MLMLLQLSKGSGPPLEELQGQIASKSSIPLCPRRALDIEAAGTNLSGNVPPTFSVGQNGIALRIRFGSKADMCSALAYVR